MILSIKALEFATTARPCALIYPPQLYPLNMHTSVALATMQNSVLQKSILDQLTKSNFDPLLVLHKAIREYLKPYLMAGHPRSCQKQTDSHSFFIARSPKSLHSGGATNGWKIRGLTYKYGGKTLNKQQTEAELLFSCTSLRSADLCKQT